MGITTKCLEGELATTFATLNLLSVCRIYFYWVCKLLGVSICVYSHQMPAKGGQFLHTHTPLRHHSYTALKCAEQLAVELDHLHINLP